MKEDRGSSEEVSLDELKMRLAEFAKDRNWDKFHSPRNLLLALVGKAGELSKIFQRKGEVPRGLPDWEEKEKQRVAEELSDVLLYLVRLSDTCGLKVGAERDQVYCQAVQERDFGDVQWHPQRQHGYQFGTCSTVQAS